MSHFHLSLQDTNDLIGAILDRLETPGLSEEESNRLVHLQARLEAYASDLQGMIP